MKALATFLCVAVIVISIFAYPDVVVFDPVDFVNYVSVHIGKPPSLTGGHSFSNGVIDSALASACIAAYPVRFFVYQCKLLYGLCSYWFNPSFLADVNGGGDGWRGGR